MFSQQSPIKVIESSFLENAQNKRSRPHLLNFEKGNASLKTLIKDKMVSASSSLEFKPQKNQVSFLQLSPTKGQTPIFSSKKSGERKRIFTSTTSTRENETLPTHLSNFSVNHFSMNTNPNATTQINTSNAEISSTSVLRNLISKSVKLKQNSSSVVKSVIDPNDMKLLRSPLPNQIKKQRGKEPNENEDQRKEKEEENEEMDPMKKNNQADFLLKQKEPSGPIPSQNSQIFFSNDCSQSPRQQGPQHTSKRIASPKWKGILERKGQTHVSSSSEFSREHSEGTSFRLPKEKTLKLAHQKGKSLSKASGLLCSFLKKTNEQNSPRVILRPKKDPERSSVLFENLSEPKKQETQKGVVSEGQGSEITEILTRTMTLLGQYKQENQQLKKENALLLQKVKKYEEAFPCLKID